ncbi:hypothetical protein BX667DRAFT_425746 [Coemansia mojavensis]|nr:hypothetical protein BX667DRAFT_425746 [Coemansia mojavensis]
MLVSPHTMLANVITAAVAACTLAASSLAAPNQPSPAHQAAHAKRCGLCGGWGGAYPGFGFGFGFPFAASSTNAFNANNNFAHFNDDTVYVNNKDAVAANNNLNHFNNANVIA